MGDKNRVGIGLSYCAENLEQSVGVRNRVGIGSSYLPAWLHRLAESILGLTKSLKIPSLVRQAT